jgi:hypothetical protein
MCEISRLGGRRGISARPNIGVSGFRYGIQNRVETAHALIGRRPDLFQGLFAIEIGILNRCQDCLQARLRVDNGSFFVPPLRLRVRHRHSQRGLHQGLILDRQNNYFALRQHLHLSSFVFVLARVQVRERLPVGVPDDVGAGDLVGVPRESGIGAVGRA